MTNDSIPMTKTWDFLRRVGHFVRFSHTVFALPFALISMLVAANGLPEWRILLWILVCMVSARTTAMAFNRIADWEIDKLNPRTADRSKLISLITARVLLGISILVFILGCFLLNPLCLILCPVALAIICFYSITKHFTSYSHFFLGIALGVAPVGAWLAVRGAFDSIIPFTLAFGTLCWVFGFDLVYSTLDADFDKKMGLYSFPSRFGIPAALKLSLILHAGAAVVFGCFGILARCGWPYWIGWVAILPLLFVEQKWARSGDPGKTNKAFFEVNAAVSILLLAGVSCSLWWYR